MFECKSCGGALHFDVATQMMQCSYCGQNYEPDLFRQQGNAEEYKDYEVTIFTCPQCGGQMGSTETSAAEFCSFCGAPTILESRLSKMKRPAYIIPFKKTKEECKEELTKHLKKNYFVTKDFKDCEIDRIRGIYMPTWNYNIKQEGTAAFSYNTQPASDPDHKYYYRIHAKLDARFEGISHDASESFADSISETLEPYNYKERLDFNPAYVAGFFSDIQDVDEGKYEKDAMELVAKYTFDQVKSQVMGEFREILEDPKEGQYAQKIPTELEPTDNTLIPVWFLSYRKGERVAYATINGETGKVVSDAPISIPKVWLLALLFAIPIFIFFNMFFTLIPETLLAIACCALGLAAFLYFCESDEIEQHEKNANFQKAERKEASGRRPAEEDQSSQKQTQNDQPRKKRSWKDYLFGVGAVGCAIILLPVILFVAYLAVYLIFGIAMSIFKYVLLGIGLVITFMVHVSLKGTPYSPRKYTLLPLLAAILSVLVFFGKPISDGAYYGAVMLDFLVILYVLSSIWKAINILTTRPLPQFAARGGEEYE